MFAAKNNNNNKKNITTMSVYTKWPHYSAFDKKKLFISPNADFSSLAQHF